MSLENTVEVTSGEMSLFLWMGKEDGHFPVLRLCNLRRQARTVAATLHTNSFSTDISLFILMSLRTIKLNQ